MKCMVSGAIPTRAGFSATIDPSTSDDIMGSLT